MRNRNEVGGTVSDLSGRINARFVSIVMHGVGSASVAISAGVQGTATILQRIWRSANSAGPAGGVGSDQLQRVEGIDR